MGDFSYHLGTMAMQEAIVHDEEVLAPSSFFLY